MATGGAPFVGRARELDVLVRMARVSMDGSVPTATVVLGDPGSGKTRLIAEACSRIESGRQLRLAGYEPERHVPLASASELLRELSLVSLEGPRLRALVFQPTPTLREVDPLGMFETAYRCLRRMGPAVLTIDDAQWMDEQTRALCHYLVRASAASGGPLAVIAASRPTDATSAFIDSLRHVLGDDRTAELPLGPLGPDEATRLVMAIAPALGDERVSDICEKAVGSPFWLEALARNGGSEDQAGRVLTSRLQGLASDPISVLAVLVVGARPLSQDDLVNLLAWEPRRVAEAIVQLVNRGVAVEEATTVRITHDLIRWTAAREIAVAETVRVHHRLAEWLEGGAGEDVQLLVEAMQHERAAGTPSIRLALRLARSSQRRLIGAEGLRQLDEIADQTETAPDAVALQQGVASLAVELGEWEIALARWEALSRHLLDRSERAGAAFSTARASWELSRAPSALFHLGRCRELEPDPILAIECDALEAQVLLWLENRREEARIPRSRAVTAARRLVESAGGARTLDGRSRRAYLSALQAEFDGNLRDERFPDLVAIVDAMSTAVLDLGEECRVALNLVICLQPLGLWREAETRFRRLKREAQRRVMPRTAGEAAFGLAFVLSQLGPLAEAYEVAREASDLAERVGAPDRFTVSEVRSIQYDVAVSHLDWRQGVAGIAEQAAQESDPHARMMRYLWMAVWLARFEGLAAGRRVIAQLSAGRTDMLSAGCDRCAGEFTLFEAEALARIDELDEARSVLTGWEANHPSPDAESARVRAHVGALLVARSETPASSLPVFEELFDEVRGIGVRRHEVWLRLDLGDALARTDRERAVEALTRAAAFAEDLGARSEQRRAEQLLRALGVRTWHRSPSRGTGSSPALTDRELEIARLVAEGASNPEIAEVLFLSRKTIERHVSNILAKLSVRNRAELAATLAKHRSGER